MLEYHESRGLPYILQKAIPWDQGHNRKKALALTAEEQPKVGVKFPQGFYGK